MESYAIWPGNAAAGGGEWLKNAQSTMIVRTKGWEYLVYHRTNEHKRISLLSQQKSVQQIIDHNICVSNHCHTYGKMGHCVAHTILLYFIVE